MSLDEDILEIFTTMNFNEACATIIRTNKLHDKIEPFLIFCVHYTYDARHAASTLLLFANNTVTDKGVTLRSLKNKTTTLSTRDFLEDIKALGQESLDILSNYPFGLPTINLDNETRRILTQFGNWIRGDNLPIEHSGRTLLAREFMLELNELAIVLIECAQIAAIKMKIFLASVEKNMV